jgi:hypothetical protein
LQYLLILFVVALALAPLTHFLPSKRLRKQARMRELAAVHGLFVEFRDLPVVEAPAGREARTQQVIYYGKRLQASRGHPRPRRAWLREDARWRGLQRRWEVPCVAREMPHAVLALSIDEGSCGVYWQEAGEEDDVALIVAALARWERSLTVAK